MYLYDNRQKIQQHDMFAYCGIIFTVKDDVVRIDKFSILISFFFALE